jgi:DNA-binding PucR family transcriptional regulator
VHPNTLRYRLKRATEVSGLDVTRPRQLLALQLLLEV